MDKLGRYRIEARIGEGAMADVFRALDPDIGRTVAIKTLKPDYRRDPELGARFLREARAAGALNHPNIATIYDVGEADSVPYIAMELIDGRPLDIVLQAQGRMPFERVLALGAQLADALAWAHAQGIVHRDVKPSNILLSSDGKTAKLLDFGVARVGDADGQLARTQAGQMIGTPRYMSPEQALGLPVDARSDLFSLGAVLYEMVTGKTAFDATGLATLALQIAQEKVTPIERSAADCLPGLRQIIDKLLAKKPDQRFADGAQLLQALRRETAALTAEDSVARRGLSLRFKLPLALVSITLVALVLSISTVLTRQQHALEQMAIASGETIATFVTKNAAVSLADNAGLPPEEQDWAPLQAFVAAASQEGGVRGIVVVDASGTIRAASDARRVGQRYTAPTGEHRLSDSGPAVTSAADAKGGALRFVRPIRYAGADFGSVDLLLPRTSLDAAMANARTLMIALASIVMLVVLAIGYLSGAMVVRPLRRLQQSFDAAREQGFALRISHRRRDEIGALFDGFNRLAAEIEPRLHDIAPEAPGLEATRIQIAPKAGRLNMYMLQLFDADDSVQPIDARLLRDGAIRIGRDTTCDWPIADPDRALSREHCEVAASTDGLIVRPIGTNGVFNDATGERLPDLVDVAVGVPFTLRLGRFRIAATHAPLDDEVTDTTRTMVLTPPLGASTAIPSDWADAQPIPASSGESLLEAFCRGAGLDASLLSSEEPVEVMERAGAVYRQMVLGIADLMVERDRARGRYNLSRTTIGGTGNNPFKWAPTQRLAIDLLLSGVGGFLSGPAAISSSLQDVKRHLIATFAGLQASLRQAVATFDPQAIDAAVSKNNGLLKSKHGLQAQEIEARHADLTRQLDGAEGTLDRAFVQAYAAAEQAK